MKQLVYYSAVVLVNSITPPVHNIVPDSELLLLINSKESEDLRLLHKILHLQIHKYISSSNSIGFAS